MHASTVVALLGASSLALAAPAAAPKKFTLKAHVIKAVHPNAHSHFDGTFVYPIHTGAGTNDVQLVAQGNPEKEDPISAFINGTQLQFDFPNSPAPFLASLPTEVQYSAWQAVEINSIDGDSYGQFFLNSTGLQWSSIAPGKGKVGGPLDEFGGWLACDWWHQVPQLFWLNKAYNVTSTNGGKTSGNCEAIQLLPVYA